MTSNYLQWIDSSFSLYILIAFLMNGAISFFWHQKIYNKLELKVYEGIQRIHLNETPRLGGLIIIALLMTYTCFHAKSNIVPMLKLFLISIIPLGVISLKEDLFHNVKPFLRLLAIFLSGILFVINFSGPYPNFSGINMLSWLDNRIAQILFYPLALSALANGNNLTDGVNGLCGFISLSILGSLMFLAYQVNDTDIMMIIFIFMALIFSFLCFNYPFGKIFLGDLGAYSIGFLIGMLTIIFFGRHAEISPLFPLLILIYPTLELVFSILRRLNAGQPIFVADVEHIHIKIFYFLRQIPQLKRYANPAVIAILSIFWLYPMIVIPWVFKKPILILLFIPLFVLMYIGLYLFLPPPKK
jgi:UDP-GlcNAc:undecaprenyl-phosphate GlcNAc-1-phosphate transferase